MGNPEAKRILIAPCALHSSQPNDQECAEAMERWKGQKLTTCIACGREIGVARFHLRHEPLLYGGRSRHRWTISDFDYLDPAVVLRTLLEEGGIHLSCMRSALPYAPWLTEVEAEFAEKSSYFDSRDPKSPHYP